MNARTRKRVVTLAASSAVAIAGLLVLAPANAFAAPGTATSTVNVRSGPGTAFAIVSQLAPGERVDIGQCQGDWCYVTHNPGNDGWVSRAYLVSGNPPPPPPPVQPRPPQGPSVTFGQPGLGITVGPNGVQIGVGQQPAPPPPPKPQPQPPKPQPPKPTNPPAPDRVCFFDGPNYTGASFCATPGQNFSRLDNWNDRISSFRNDNKISVQVCADNNFVNCRTYTTSANVLGSFDNLISSIKVPQ